ncbi:MAG: anti-sigma factor family protein [bacterium]|jgi:hypothetical protein
MHIPDAKLRAKLDGELPAAESLAAEQHLDACARCRARYAGLARAAAEVQAHFADLPSAPEVDVAAALARTRVRAAAGAREHRPWFPRLTPAWAVLAAAVFAVVLVSSGTARAAAGRFLSFLRVKNVVVIPVERPAFNDGKGKLIQDFLASNVQVLKDERARPVSSREEAAEIAGFPVRLPTALTEQPQLIVEGAREVQFNVDLKRAQTLLTVLERPDLKLPAELDGAKVAIDVPRGVLARYGDCEVKRHDPDEPPPVKGQCINVMQIPAPTVVTVPEIDLAGVAEIGLQLTGMGPEEAKAFARAVDWSSTLAIPVPVGLATHQTVTIEGVEGVLAVANPAPERPAMYSLVWVKNGVIHTVSGRGNPSMAVPVAQSLQ